jgi:hypothetical protein
MSKLRNDSKRRIIGVAIAMAWLLLATAPAVSAKRSTTDTDASKRAAQERAARKACLNGDYAKGVGILSDLFIDTKVHTYIFNQGRCLEQNQRYEDAIGKFEEYLRAGSESLGQEDKDVAQKHIADCKEKLPADRQPAPSGAPQPFIPPSPVATPPEPMPEPVTAIVVKPKPATPASTGAGLRIAGIVTASVGVAAVATAVLLNLKVNSMVDEMETKRGDYTASKDDDQKTYRSLAWVGYGVGAACVVGGAIMYGLGVRARSTSSKNLALVPMVSPGHFGAALAGGF